MTGSWHGTLSGYTNHRCRCDACRAAWAAYHREYYRRSADRTPKVLTDERTAQTTKSHE